MNLENARQFLSLNPNDSEAKRFAAYEAMRDKLEGKLAKAPTPGLKEKYRKTLKQMEEAIEAIEISLDGGDLPTLSPNLEKEAVPPPREPALSSRSPSPAPTAPSGRRSRKKEVWVMAITVAVLSFGGFRYWSAQASAEGARTELARALPSFAEEIESTKARYSELIGKRSTLGIRTGDELETIDIEKWEKDLRNRFSMIEQMQNAEQWETALGNLKISQSICDDLNRKLDTGYSNTAKASERIEKFAVDNFLENVWLNHDIQKVRIALSSSLELDVNQSDPELGFTALSKAAYNGNLEIVSLLLARSDIDVNKKNEDGESPLNTACIFQRKNRKLIELLLAHPDIDVNSRSNDDTSPLVTAAIHNEIWLLETLLSRPDILVNISSIQQRSPLAVAASNRHLEATRILLNHPNISVNQRDSSGKTALTIANTPYFNPFGGGGEVNSDVVQLLISRGAQE